MMYDILFLAETWDCNFSIVTSDYLYLCGTNMQEKPVFGRASGGITCLARPQIAAGVSHIDISANYIKLKFKNVMLCGVYIPPSINDTNFINILDKISNVDVLFGDINTRFGKEFGDSVKTCPGRRRSIARWCARNSIEHLKPEGERVRVDHAFGNPQRCSATVNHSPVQTDHPLIAVIVQHDESNNNVYNTLNPTRRYFLKNLSENNIQALQERYDAVETVQQFYDQTVPMLYKMNVQERALFVDNLYDRLLKATSHVCEEVLGSYEVNEARARPDSLLDTLKPSSDNSTVAKIFKRSLRFAQNRLIPSSPEIALVDEIYKYFSAIYIPEDTANYALSGEQESIYGTGSYEFADLIDGTRIVDFFRRYSTAKSCGPDALHTRLIRALLPSKFGRHITILFKLFCIIGITPSNWNLVCIYPLPKLPEAKFISQCRPIALSNMFRRCFESFVLQTLEHHEECKLLRNFNRLQGGFRRGNSTLTHAALSNDLGVQHPDIHRGFIDFSNAYDRVPLNLLIKKMSDRRAPTYIISLVISLFRRTQLSVVANGCTQTVICPERGLLQGSLLSPFLFNVFIDDLSMSLDNITGIMIGGLVFADDVQVMAHNQEKLQIQMNIIHDWSMENMMKINMSKSAYMAPTPMLINIGNSALQRATSYKYLGFEHRRRTIDFEEFSTRLAGKAKAVWRRSRIITDAMFESTRLTVFKSFIRPMMEYGLPLIWQLPVNQKDQILNRYEVIINDSVKWVLPFTNSPRTARAVLGLPDIRIRAEALASNFKGHVLSLSPDHPAQHMITAHRRRPPWRDGLIIIRAINNKLYDQLVKDSIQIGVKYNTLMKKWVLRQVEDQSLIARYITNTARRNGFGADRSLYWDDDELREFSLRWRVGSYGLRKYCPNMHPFNRACVNRCSLLTGIDVERISRLRRPVQEPEHFCIVDHILNSQDMILTRQVLEALNLIVQR
jgi:hypothetical protein